MNNEELIEQNKVLIEENEKLKLEIDELNEKLKKYTNSQGHKKYYEKNKNIVMEKSKSYLQKLKEENPDKLKEYRKTAYLNRKNKKKEIAENKNI
jgi:cell division septum initiation protein DivIVA